MEHCVHLTLSRNQVDVIYGDGCFITLRQKSLSTQKYQTKITKVIELYLNSFDYNVYCHHYNTL